MTINMSANRQVSGGFKQEPGLHPVSTVFDIYVILLRYVKTGHTKVLEQTSRDTPKISQLKHRCQTRRGYERVWRTLVTPASSEGCLYRWKVPGISVSTYPRICLSQA
jgi:hypothetical protein